MMKDTMEEKEWWGGEGDQWSCIHKPSSEKAETQREERKLTSREI